MGSIMVSMHMGSIFSPSKTTRVNPTHPCLFKPLKHIAKHNIAQSYSKHPNCSNPIAASCKSYTEGCVFLFMYWLIPETLARSVAGEHCRSERHQSPPHQEENFWKELFIHQIY